MGGQDLLSNVAQALLRGAQEPSEHGPAGEVFQPAVFDSGPIERIRNEPYYSSSVKERFPSELFTTAITAAGNPPPVYHGADISYEYNEQKHLARRAFRLQTEGLSRELPNGWPKALQGPLVWSTSDYQDESLFVYPLSDPDRAEILSALQHFKGSGVEESKVGQTSFPLPNLGKTLDSIKEDIYQGRGFATLRGLPVDTLSSDDLSTVYLGLSSYIAGKRGKQNHQGTMMINVINFTEGAQKESSETQMPFHTDLCCDTLAMLTLSCGSQGGAGILASAWTVYNELVETRPDLVHVLAEPNWPFDTHGRDPPYYTRALMYLEDGKLITNFSRRLLVGHHLNGPRTPGIPGLSEAQSEALDTLHETGRQHEVRQPMVKGDIRFINNLALMHRRDTFIDDLDDHRHLLRLWLNNPESCWKLPQDLQLAWERIFNDDQRDSAWHFVRFTPSGICYAEPLWQLAGPAPAPDDGQGPTPPPPVAACD